LSHTTSPFSVSILRSYCFFPFCIWLIGSEY
jgi:hypothetical protein